MDFDIIPFEDIKWSHRLGAGSFGSVYKGQYLGIDIAVKEVLPSNEYDVHKYFEREWRIMRECRHPNIVLFLGLSKGPDGRVFIVSEYVPRGNLRQFILSSQPFPWRLRLSFATDIARALAYLHARQCIHRDLKGENLLITSNERIKMTDFGFARITSRNEEELRRMTYCGTDGYMSPEIINGLPFDLPADIFSLGIIFIEIISRRLVDSKNFSRQAPDFLPDSNEVRRRATPGCPPALIDLALACVQLDPASRPRMPEVLARLREIEVEVLTRLPEAEGEHVGSVKLLNHGGKRAIPVFDDITEGEGKGTAGGAVVTAGECGDGDGVGVAKREEGSGSESEEDDVEEDALIALAKLDIDGKGASVVGTRGSTWRTARWEDQISVISHYATTSEMRGRIPPLALSETSTEGSSSTTHRYSTNVIRAKPVETASKLHGTIPFNPDSDSSNPPAYKDVADEKFASHEPAADETASVLTVKGGSGRSFSDCGNIIKDAFPQETAEIHVTEDGADCQGMVNKAGKECHSRCPKIEQSSAMGPIPSLNSCELVSSLKIRPKNTTTLSGNCDGADAGADAGGGKLPTSASQGALGTHRFTLVNKDPTNCLQAGRKASSSFATGFAFAFLPKALASGKDKDKCPVCHKRMGQRAALQCDDCAILVHVKCSHVAPRNCTLTTLNTNIDST